MLVGQTMSPLWIRGLRAEVAGGRFHVSSRKHCRCDKGRSSWEGSSSPSKRCWRFDLDRGLVVELTYAAPCGWSAKSEFGKAVPVWDRFFTRQGESLHKP